MKLPGNMKSMMKQAEKMKQQMEQLQEKAGEEIIEVSSKGKYFLSRLRTKLLSQKIKR